MDKHTVGQPSPVIQDEMPGAPDWLRQRQEAARVAQHPSQYPSDDTPAIAAPAARTRPAAGIPWPPGYMGRLAQLFHESSIRPVKEVSITTALGVMAGTAGRQQQRLLSKFDKLSRTLDQQIKGMDEMLTGPLQQKAGMGTLNTEIRNHVRAMPTEERQKFLEDALARKDLTTLTAILGGPGYLSGLMDAEVTHYTRKLHEIQHPEVVGRLTALRSAKAHVEKVGPLVMGQVEKAMGSDWGRVQALREGNDKALAALKFGQ